MVESFSERYYNVFDTRRVDVDKFYQNDAKLVWNGIELNGRDAITKHLISLPTTRHQIQALDFFPMKGSSVRSFPFNNVLSSPFEDLFPNEPTTYQVFTSGVVIYGAPESNNAQKEKRLFSHVFVLTVDVNSSIWVIANECFRFHE